MKKTHLIPLIAVILCIFLLVGCGNTDSKNSTSSVSVSSVSGNMSSSETDGFTLNGVSLAEYNIVYDEDDIFSQFAAEILSEELNAVSGVLVDVVPDSVTEQKNEMLIGETNRVDSVSAYEIKTDDDEFVLTASDDKVVMTAKGYMVGGAVNELLELCKESTDIKISKNTKPQKYEFKKAKNAILMIGDGMGHNHINAALKEGMPEFYAAAMPNVGTAVTYSHSVTLGNAEYTDSAAAGTALATGYKTVNGYLGLNSDIEIVPNVRELAFEQGAKTAVLTTDAITGATPSAFMVHCSDRNNTSAIQGQIDSLFALGKITIAEGSLDDNLLSREKNALSTISSDNSRFFMMLEEGYIDKHSHNNDYDKMIHTVKRFNDTVAYAMEFTLMHPDTVLIVTADHETGDVRKEADGTFTFNSTNHTNKDVPLFAMGKGTESLTKKPCNNINIAKFIATVFGEKNFGE